VVAKKERAKGGKGEGGRKDKDEDEAKRKGRKDNGRREEEAEKNSRGPSGTCVYSSRKVGRRIIMQNSMEAARGAVVVVVLQKVGRRW